MSFGGGLTTLEMRARTWSRSSNDRVRSLVAPADQYIAAPGERKRHAAWLRLVQRPEAVYQPFYGLLTSIVA